MRRIFIVGWVSALVGGCAANAAAPAHAPVTAADAPESERDTLATMVSKQAESQKRINELESRIALLEAEGRSRRGVNDKRAETVRIGAPEPVAVAPRPRARHREEARALDESDVSQDESDSESAERESARRGKERLPTLRLYGPSKESMALPEMSPADSKLSVVPLPEDRAKALTATGASSEAASADSATAAYKSALRNLREQRYDDAISAFAAFAKQFPDHALIANALYWRGEAHYAKRDYPHARESFDALLEQHAQSDKVPDALVKLGLCLRRLGDEAQAKAYFKRVREKYPNTEAAAIASREGST